MAVYEHAPLDVVADAIAFGESRVVDARENLEASKRQMEADAIVLQGHLDHLEVWQAAKRRLLGWPEPEVQLRGGDT